LFSTFITEIAENGGGDDDDDDGYDNLIVYPKKILLHNILFLGR
jgi:hypothetical protein